MCKSWNLQFAGMVGVGNQDSYGDGATACVCQVGSFSPQASGDDEKSGAMSSGAMSASMAAPISAAEAAAAAAAAQRQMQMQSTMAASQPH
jgi:hypothetical protein